MRELRVDANKYEILIKKMEHLGVVEDVQTVMGEGGYAVFFRPSAYAISLSREIEIEQQEEGAPPDIIEQLRKRVRQNPWTAWPIIVFLLLALLIPMLNSLLELLGKIVNFFR